MSCKLVHNMSSSTETCPDIHNVHKSVAVVELDSATLNLATPHRRTSRIDDSKTQHHPDHTSTCFFYNCHYFSVGSVHEDKHQHHFFGKQ